MLRTHDLGKRFAPAGPWAIRHINLVVPDGALVMLLGANGAGKTTTINCCLDFIRPSEGRAMVDEIEVSVRPLEAKKRLAYLSENLAVYPTLSGLQNLVFFARLGLERALERGEAVELLTRMGLPALAVTRPVKEYSKGMRQKLGLAIAMARGAGNFLLDEPTTGLDPVSARELLETLRMLRDGGAALLLSTHDVFRAAAADHVYVMRAGSVIAEFARGEIAGRDLEHEYITLMGAA